MYNNKRITVLIPTRGDRPKLLDNCKILLSKQSVQPDDIFIIDDAPITHEKDITWRYRIGCERILERLHKNQDDALIFLIEDDDYYSPNYIETMSNQWLLHGSPEIFGIGETYYYHLGINKIHHVNHPKRASAFSTLFTTGAARKMKWPKDNFPFTDIELWKVLNGTTFIPERPISIGIKGHTNTIVGGAAHNPTWRGYNKPDPSRTWLKNNMDDESFKFYSQC